MVRIVAVGLSVMAFCHRIAQSIRLLERFRTFSRTGWPIPHADIFWSLPYEKPRNLHIELKGLPDVQAPALCGIQAVRGQSGALKCVVRTVRIGLTTYD
ncbi:MAG TPA: hypothetical protein ENN81_08955 [Phycisphaerales bacterium]|nr:hypothetical protein [Phycisphaerales bacterium]